MPITGRWDESAEAVNPPTAHPMVRVSMKLHETFRLPSGGAAMDIGIAADVQHGRHNAKRRLAMTTAENTAASDKPDSHGESPAQTIRVWDPFVRFFHWSLVATFTIAFVSAEEWDTLHEWIGYAAAALVALRILWGFAGSRHARFSDFVRGPSAVLSYLSDVAAGREKRFLGHNPVGGAMILALLAGILALGVTGYWMTASGSNAAEALEEIHEAIANGMLVLIALHVAGVAYASLRHKENLVSAMFSGRKRAKD